MVLINGVKYACERCIRGHRVTSCTHTDQPLTMIKPKGRPASQCQHCRDQRKNKSLHISCACSKKAGHSVSCAKNPGSCTCYLSHKTKIAEKSKKKPKDKEPVKVEEALKVDDDFIKSNSDLFEFLNRSQFQSFGDLTKEAELNEKKFDNYMDFPLFPLIGNQSFDNENMPMCSSSQAPSTNNDSNSSTKDTTPGSTINSGFSYDGFLDGNVNIQGTQINRSLSYKNRPSSVLSVNSNSSATDLRNEGAYPPSGPINNFDSNSNSNSNVNLIQNGGLINPAPRTMQIPFNNILESNELHILDEDIEHFLDDYDNNPDLVGL